MMIAAKKVPPKFMKKFLFQLSCAIGFACLSASAWSGIKEARTAYAQGDFASALTQIKPLAEGGDAESQFF
ncbi:hypothetical protein AAKU61_002400 [Undibacterium sp. GrIS 1.2]